MICNQLDLFQKIGTAADDILVKLSTGRAPTRSAGNPLHEKHVLPPQGSPIPNDHAKESRTKQKLNHQLPLVHVAGIEDADPNDSNDKHTDKRRAQPAPIEKVCDKAHVPVPRLMQAALEACLRGSRRRRPPHPKR